MPVICSLRPSSTRTRIKTELKFLIGSQLITLWDHPPQEQGLRPIPKTTHCRTCFPLRPSSTRTRIKTSAFRDHFGVRCDALRPSSTRTRIKTEVLISSKLNIIILWDHPPQEQGLRRVVASKLMSMSFSILWDHPPQEQGLRLGFWCL